jgi:hypothetical protein
VRPTGRARALLALLGLALPLAGCGLLTLTHDEMIGPISPAGRIHDAAVGGNFEANIEGFTADATGEPRFRPYPRDLIRRLGSPSSLHALTGGLEAFLMGSSTYAERRARSGATPNPSRIPPPGSSLDAVLTALGPPDAWARFVGGATLAYRARRERRTILNVGIPPALGFLIPFPGASNLAYRRISKNVHNEGFVLFFDESRRLERVAPATAP